MAAVRHSRLPLFSPFTFSPLIARAASKSIVPCGDGASVSVPIRSMSPENAVARNVPGMTPAAFSKSRPLS